MARDKPRLQLALYARPKLPGSYHYALLVAPKNTKDRSAVSVTKHHALNTVQNVSGSITQPWRYERVDVLNINNERNILARVIIAKVTAIEALDSVLNAVPIYQVDDQDSARAQSFSCRTWLQAALNELKTQRVVLKLADFESIHNKAVQYVEKKKLEGRWDENWMEDVPTLDLIEGREIVG